MQNCQTNSNLWIRYVFIHCNVSLILGQKVVIAGYKLLLHCITSKHKLKSWRKAVHHHIGSQVRWTTCWREGNEKPWLFIHSLLFSLPHSQSYKGKQTAQSCNESHTCISSTETAVQTDVSRKQSWWPTDKSRDEEYVREEDGGEVMGKAWGGIPHVTGWVSCVRKRFIPLFADHFNKSRTHCLNVNPDSRTWGNSTF
jgi:hypothetical protein